MSKHLDTERRGPLFRPGVLEICATCCSLRGPHRGHDNVCDCDIEAWKPDCPPGSGDLMNNVILCRGCLTELVTGSSRWSSFYCDPCREWVVRTGKRHRRCIVPLGRHSIMNGTYWRSDGGSPSPAQAVAFADQLTASLATVGALHDLTTRRLRTRLSVVAPGEQAIDVDDFLQRCGEWRWTSDAGRQDFADLVLQRHETPVADDFIGSTLGPTP